MADVCQECGRPFAAYTGINSCRCRLEMIERDHQQIPPAMDLSNEAIVGRIHEARHVTYIGLKMGPIRWWQFWRWHLRAEYKRQCVEVRDRFKRLMHCTDPLVTFDNIRLFFSDHDIVADITTSVIDEVVIKLRKPLDPVMEEHFRSRLCVGVRYELMVESEEV